jgi:hypothetical protein
MINKNSFAKAKASAPVKLTADELIERLNGALESAPQQEQYAAIKDLVNNAAVATLKAHFEIEEYVSTHRMRWDLINAYNADQ